MAEQIERVTPDIVVERMKSGEPIVVLDVRSPDAYESATEDLEGAVRMDPGRFNPEFVRIDKNLPVYTFCT